MRKRAVRRAPPTSRGIDDFSAELVHAGDRRKLMDRVRALKKRLSSLLAEEEFELVEFSGRAAKKNLAQRFSESVAQKIANELRKSLPGILPDANGGGHESFSRGASGVKKLDVNFSSTKSGLELAVSVKTINFADDQTKRFTKNTKRVDGELRAEAQDCHRRQPFAVLAAYLFLPEEAARDGEGQGKSSAKQVGEVLAARAGRRDESGPADKLELAFLGLYQDEGSVRFHRPEDLPDRGVPEGGFLFSQTLREVLALHTARNRR